VKIVGKKAPRRTYKRGDLIQLKREPQLQAVVIGYAVSWTRDYEQLLIEYSGVPPKMSRLLIGVMALVETESIWEKV
jgi:hypothetical protein